MLLLCILEAHLGYRTIKNIT